MKIRSFFIKIFAASCLATALTGTSEVIEGTINAYRLNVRVKPGKFTVVGQLKRGDVVQIVEEKGGWYRIALPPGAPVWVSDKFVKDGKISKRVYLRSGPGINYRSYGFASVGQQVTILDEKKKDWLKIKPVPNMTAWVSAKYVKVPEKNKPETKPELKNDPEKIPEKYVKTELPFIDEPAEEVHREGVLLAVNKSGTILTHALCFYEGGKYKPICYLYGDDSELAKVVGKKVRVKGSLRWVKKWNTPVVKVFEVEKISK